MILRPRSWRRAKSPDKPLEKPRNKPWDQHRETCHRKRYHDRRQRSDAAPGLHRRRQPHAVHPRARPAGSVHAGRSRRRLRAAAAHAPAVCAQCVRPGHSRLRQCHGRRDEPRAHRRAAPRHGRGDDRVHGADQLRLRHAVDRHRLPVHPPGQRRSHSRRRRRGAQPRAADVSPKRGRLVCTAVRRPRSVVAGKGRRRFSSVVPRAGRSASSAG